MRRRDIWLSLPKMHPSVCGGLLSFAHDLRAAICRVWRRMWVEVLSTSLWAVILRAACKSVCQSHIHSIKGESCTKNTDIRPARPPLVPLATTRHGYGYITTDRARQKVPRGQGRQRAYRTQIDQVASLQLQLPSASSKVCISASSFLRAATRLKSEAE